MTLLFLLLATIGMCHIVVDGSIFNSFRERMAIWSQAKGIKKFIGSKISDIVKCYQCFGMYAGVFMGLFIKIIEMDTLPYLFMCGCAGSFASLLGAVIIMYLNAGSE